MVDRGGGGEGLRGAKWVCAGERLAEVELESEAVRRRRERVASAQLGMQRLAIEQRRQWAQGPSISALSPSPASFEFLKHPTIKLTCDIYTDYATERASLAGLEMLSSFRILLSTERPRPPACESMKATSANEEGVS